MAKTKLLIEDTEQEYEIFKEDIPIYAQQIGIDIKTEKHLMWIAEQGLCAKVPEPWKIYSDGKDRIFYHNPDTLETTWYHPADKEFSALVSEERSKSKSLNSASSDYGFESKLSSLADAPPLSSSGKNSPLPLTRGKNDGGLSRRKIEFGHIENRRGAQLAPVRLNTLKMPAASTPKSSGMSFMPKGATLTRNIKKVKAEAGNQIEELDYRHPPPDDSNESLNSDEGSKYSYEETEDEEKSTHGLEPYMLDASHLSPMHSADESPDALDINSLVQLGTKLPQKFDNNTKTEHVENVNNKENSPALSLRKVGQPSFLKPLSQTTKKKGGNKCSKATKKALKINYPTESEIDYEDKFSEINDEHRIILEQMQKEWIAMQDEIEKQEKEKYENMQKDSSKKLEEEQTKLRNENLEKITKIKIELQKKIEEEESAAEKALQTLKASNKEKIIEEEKRLKKELEVISDSLKNEIKKIEEKNATELAKKKQELEEAFKKEVEHLKLVHDSNKKNIEEDHTSEISSLQKLYEQEIEMIESGLKKRVDETKNKVDDSIPKGSELQKEIENLKLLTKEENEKYEKILKEKEIILKDLNCEKDNLVKLKQETDEMQARIVEVQDEIEKTENDLDLLRSEKSGLISELNILKENIKNEKSNLLNLEKKVKSIEADCSKEFSEIGISTHLSVITISKDVQASVTYCDVSSQVENITISMSNAMCQTSISNAPNVDTKSSQTDLVPFSNAKDIMEIPGDKEVLNCNNLDKSLENALSGLSMKLDSRISVIEHHLRLLQENLSKPPSSQPAYSNEEFMQRQFAEVRTVPNSENRNIPPVYSNSVPLGLFSNNSPVSSHNKCKCELGDSASCDVLQDMKNSVYRLNDILCTSFVPPLNRSSQTNPPTNNYSSPFDSFYAQLRSMQEKHRLTELKHKCENEAIKLTKGISNLNGANNLGNFSYKEDLKPSYHLMHSNLFSHNVPEDPLIQARNIVLKEQARAWKDQQLLNSSMAHIFSLNSSSESSQSSVTGFTSSQNVPSSQQTFLKFEVDPETDYNMWMTRLNALQLRIRSHSHNII